MLSPYCFTHRSLFFMHHFKDASDPITTPHWASDSDIFDEMAMRPRFSACEHQPHKAHKARQGVFLNMCRTLPSGGFFWNVALLMNMLIPRF